MITVTSTYANTPIVPANAHGPYLVPGGSSVTLTAGPADPSGTYSWDLGDGTTANTASVTHAYGEHGVYIAKVTVVVNQPGGARTRDFAEIVVSSVTPTVQLTGPDTVDEGQIVTFSGSYTDAEWLDPHTARWDWDDRSPPQAGVVTETHQPPACTGTLQAQHAWGHSGTYLVTLSIIDSDGTTGRATKTVTVLNVPPAVVTPREVYAYPCTVTTLQANFTDPGWLDWHIGTWDFGDARCTAIIRESHVAPIGRGTATASHIFRHLGVYRARCVVTDDDGASGDDDTVVHVVDVRNRRFEDGFRLRLCGEAANSWEPYSMPLAPIGPGQPPPPGPLAAAPFSAQALLLHDGRRAQRIRPAAAQRAGLWQRVGANVGWEYQVTVWYSLAQRSDEVDITNFDPEDADTWARPDCARLGVDPTGGNDPTNPAIAWSRGTNRLEWQQLSVAASAKGEAVTIFLEASGGDLLSADVCFDEVELIPTCRVLSPKSTPGSTEQCCSFENVPLGQVPTPLQQDGFTISGVNMAALEIVALGDPAGTHKLVLPSQPLQVLLPFDSTSVVATIAALREETMVVIEALSTDGTSLGMTTQSLGLSATTVTVAAAGIHSVVITHLKSVTLLVRICASKDGGTSQ